MAVLLKILVCYHKPAKLFDDDVFMPIHVGRGCCSLSEEDYQWMMDNMIGDDTGDNISSLNSHFAELTAIYWAWKNYDKLDNPDYIGFCHYRRLFAKEDIDTFADYDITAPFETNGDEAFSTEVWQRNHGTTDLNEAIDLLSSQYPQYAKLKVPYLNQTQGYYYNMFIMKREMFFEYCEKIFPILFEIHQNMDYPYATYYNQRMPGFVAERLTGLFIAEKEKQCKVKKCQHWHVEESACVNILPQFGKDGIAVCLSADDNYAQYLGVTIASIKANCNSNDKYEIYILDGGIKEINKKRILSLMDDMLIIRFLDIKAYLSDVDTSIFSLNAHFTVATYYRFFIPQIFKNFDKILYVDCDLIVHHNLAEIYHCDMKGFALAAVPDIEIHRCLMSDRLYKGTVTTYLNDKLKMKHPDYYFQAGVLLLDVKKLQKMNFTDICLKKLVEIKDPLYVDQCVLNAVFDGNYLPLDMKWNVLWQLPHYIKNLDQQLSYKKYIEYFAARDNPYIIHYAGAIKPWKNPEIDLAELWWKYARMSPFYEEIIYRKINSIINLDVVRDCFNHSWNRFKYFKYVLYAKIMNGRKRKKYQQKKKDMKKRFINVKNFLRDK